MDATHPPISLHMVRAADQEAWLPLWQGYQAFYKVDIPDEVTALTWSRLIDASDPVNGMLAWRSGRAIGLVHFIPHRSTWFAEDVCYLQDLYVEANTRGEGIGRRLIEAVYEEAKRRGWRRVHWLTHETNSDAMQLYDRIGDRSGFVQYRRTFS
ncbi:GNAT family N-acetyltransferase [Aureimonas sp. AU4]|uniref:GNAT family N-acetyltransferase n=1 Tax=Aureimonas sp. AU4 TaxID=1638163 RepID=UPI0007863BF8|nr:GNAT family N-acetyltransferase [Aureimonas sp. AU4]